MKLCVSSLISILYKPGATDEKSNDPSSGSTSCDICHRRIFTGKGVEEVRRARQCCRGFSVTVSQVPFLLLQFEMDKTTLISGIDRIDIKREMSRRYLDSTVRTGYAL